MKYYKMVSGKGRVEMNEDEIRNMLKEPCQDELKFEPSRMDVFEEKLDKLSKTMEKLCKSELLNRLLPELEGGVEQNGAE